MSGLNWSGRNRFQKSIGDLQNQKGSYMGTVLRLVDELLGAYKAGEMTVHHRPVEATTRPSLSLQEFMIPAVPLSGCLVLLSHTAPWTRT